MYVSKKMARKLWEFGWWRKWWEKRGFRLGDAVIVKTDRTRTVWVVIDEPEQDGYVRIGLWAASRGVRRAVCLPLPTTDDLLDALEALGYTEFQLFTGKKGKLCLANQVSADGFVPDFRDGLGPTRAEAVAACLLMVLAARKEAEDAKQAKP